LFSSTQPAPPPPPPPSLHDALPISPAPSTPEVRVGEAVFRLGDRLIVGKNNYQTLCFNGETGEIVDIGPELLTLRMDDAQGERLDRKSTRLNSSHVAISYAVFCLKK